MAEIKTVLSDEQIIEIYQWSKDTPGISFADEVRHIEAAVLSADADAVDAKIAMLTNAIEITLRENAHLADGEDCTLIHLKRAIAAQSTEGAKG